MHKIETLIINPVILKDNIFYINYGYLIKSICPFYFLFFSLEGISGCARGLLLALYSNITPGRLEPFEMLEIDPEWAVCKASVLPIVLSL